MMPKLVMLIWLLGLLAIPNGNIAEAQQPTFNESDEPTFRSKALSPDGLALVGSSKVSANDIGPSGATWDPLQLPVVAPRLLKGPDRTVQSWAFGISGAGRIAVGYRTTQVDEPNTK